MAELRPARADARGVYRCGWCDRRLDAIPGEKYQKPGIVLVAAGWVPRSAVDGTLVHRRPHRRSVDRSAYRQPRVNDGAMPMHPYPRPVVMECRNTACRELSAIP